MAAQIQLANTFNEFRQAYNTAANDINSVLEGTANAYAYDLQLAGETVGAVFFGGTPATGSGALLDTSSDLAWNNSQKTLNITGKADITESLVVNSLDVNTAVSIVGSLSSANVTANNLTTDRLVFVSNTGILTDDANLTYDSANATLSATVVNVGSGNTILYSNGYFTSANDINLTGATSRIDAYHFHAPHPGHMGVGSDIETWSAGKGQSENSHHVFAVGNQDEAVDMIVVNQSDGANAYAEFIAVNDTGDIENGWVSIGINSSNYGEGAYAVTKADDAYILYQAPANTASSGDLVIGTGGNGTGNKIIFSADGFDDPANNTQMIIHPGIKVEVAIDTESQNTSSGALVVRGGMGLLGNLNVGGNVNITGAISLLGSGNTVTTDSLAVQNPIVFIGSNNNADTLDLGLVGEYVSAGATRYTGFVRDATDGVYKIFANTTVEPANTVDFSEASLNYATVKLGSADITDTTTSNSTTTGALKVAGGVGVAGPVYVGGVIRAQDTTAATSTSTGSIVASGGVGVSGNTHIGGLTRVTDSTESSSTSTGALVVTGGAGIGGNAYVGGDASVAGDTTATGNVAISSTTASSSNTTGALTVAGGVGIAGDLYSGVTRPIAIQEKVVAVAASDIDLSLANYFTKTVSSTTTFTVSNVPSSGTVGAFILDLTLSGSPTVNWFSGVVWNAGTPPTLTGTGRDVIAFFTHDGGTTWNGFVLGQAMA